MVEDGILVFCKTCGKSTFALMTPVIILGSIYSGYATPVEASVVAIVYSLFVGFVVNRSLRPRHLYLALIEGVMTCGAVLIIVGASTLFGKILTYEHRNDSGRRFVCTKSMIISCICCGFSSGL